MWQSYLNALRVYKIALNVSDLTLQLVLKQVMHTIIKQLTSTPSESASILVLNLLQTGKRTYGWINLKRGIVSMRVPWNQ